MDVMGLAYVKERFHGERGTLHELGQCDGPNFSAKVDGEDPAM